MAELSTTAREFEKAINFYKEGLTYDETHVPVSITNSFFLVKQYSSIKVKWSLVVKLTLT